MSTAAVADAAAAAPAPAPAKKGKKKLIILIVVAVLVLAIGGVGAMLLLKKKPHDGEADGEHAEAGDHASASGGVIKPAERPAPVFVPLEPFTVNLADRDAERYAQVGITLEIADAKTGDQIKLYMPAIRNYFLLAIADNTATELLAREGKIKLGERLRRDAARALGYTVPEMAAEGGAKKEAKGDAESDEDKPAKKKKKASAKEEIELPVRAVHFSNFIVQ